MRRLWDVIRGRLRQRTVRRVDSEIAAHLEQETERLMSRGMTEAAARREAKRSFGDPERVRERTLRVAGIADRGEPPVRLIDLAVDLWRTSRALIRSPGYASLVVGTLAIGIAANSMVFAVLEQVLLQAPDLPEPSRVVTIYSDLYRLPEGQRRQPIHGTQMRRIAEDLDTVETAAGFKAAYFNLGEGEDAVRLQGLLTTDALFDVAGVRPLLGTVYRRGELRTDLVVLAHSTWREHFGGNPDIVGTRILLNRDPYEVLGVMAAGFEFPSGRDVPASFHFPARPELWVPFVPPETGPSDLGVVARLRADATVVDVQAELDGQARALEAAEPRLVGWADKAAVELQEHRVRPMRPTLVLLFLATGLVLLVAGADVAGALLVRLVGREREIAVRAALGAGSRRLMMVAVSEGLVVAALGGVMGIGVATVGLRLLASHGAESFHGASELHMSAGAAAYALGLVLVASVLSAALPAISARRARPAAVLRNGARTTGSRRTQRLGDLVVGGEIAVTLVLLVVALSMSVGLVRLLRTDPGFDPEGVLTAEITLPETAYPDAERARKRQRAIPPEANFPVAAFHRGLRERLLADSSVLEAGLVKPLPMTGSSEASVYWIEGATESEGTPLAEYTIASTGYVEAMGIPILRGRSFRDTDRHDTEPVAMVSASLASLWPEGIDPIGGRIKLGGRPDAPYPWLRVVGVLTDVKRGGLDAPSVPEMYVPLAQAGYPSVSTMQLVVRGRDGTPVSSDVVRNALTALDPTVPLARPIPMEQILAATLAQERLAVALIGGFAVTTLLLAMAGLYAVLALSVQSRLPEFGVRAALGAGAPQILRCVLTHCARLFAGGLVVGTLLAILALRLLQSALYGLAPLEPWIVIASGLTLLPAALAAAVIPARRALRADPASVLLP